MKKLLALAAAVALCVGCTHTEIDLPNNGGHYSSTSLLSNRTARKVEVKLGDGKGVEISNLDSNTTEGAAKAFEAAAAILRKAP